MPSILRNKSSIHPSLQKFSKDQFLWSGVRYLKSQKKLIENETEARTHGGLITFNLRPSQHVNVPISSSENLFWAKHEMYEYFLIILVLCCTVKVLFESETFQKCWPHL